MISDEKNLAAPTELLFSRHSDLFIDPHLSMTGSEPQNQSENAQNLIQISRVQSSITPRGRLEHRQPAEVRQSKGLFTLIYVFRTAVDWCVVTPTLTAAKAVVPTVIRTSIHSASQFALDMLIERLPMGTTIISTANTFLPIDRVLTIRIPYHINHATYHLSPSFLPSGSIRRSLYDPAFVEIDLNEEEDVETASSSMTPGVSRVSMSLSPIAFPKSIVSRADVSHDDTTSFYSAETSVPAPESVVGLGIYDGERARPQSMSIPVPERTPSTGQQATSWPQYGNGGEGLVNARQDRRCTVQDQIVKELLATERTYVAQLCALEEIYVVPTKSRQFNSNNVGSSNTWLLTTEEWNVLFSSIRSIIVFHRDHFLPQLEQCAATDIGSFFVKNSPFFRLYSPYFNSFEERLNLLTELQTPAVPPTWMQSYTYPFNSAPPLAGSLSPPPPSRRWPRDGAGGVPPPTRDEATRRNRFRTFIKESRSSPSHRELNLEAYLILPVQRLPRYKLLLERLVEKVPTSHPDYPKCVKALEEIMLRADECNERKRDWEDRVRGLEVLRGVMGRSGSVRNLFFSPGSAAGSALGYIGAVVGSVTGTRSLSPSGAGDFDRRGSRRFIRGDKLLVWKRVRWMTEPRNSLNIDVEPIVWKPEVQELWRTETFLLFSDMLVQHFDHEVTEEMHVDRPNMLRRASRSSDGDDDDRPTRLTSLRTRTPSKTRRSLYSNGSLSPPMSPPESPTSTNGGFGSFLFGSTVPDGDVKVWSFGGSGGDVVRVIDVPDEALDPDDARHASNVGPEWAFEGNRRNSDDEEVGVKKHGMQKVMVLRDLVTREDVYVLGTTQEVCGWAEEIESVVVRGAVRVRSTSRSRGTSVGRWRTPVV
ncbi:hypothetical protein BJ742DRAFT_781190 [Cladochytrium replicatum]|nr:hypothetical protein BJ742DRAFT_781190 [Cladochytrium replicatum]